MEWVDGPSCAEILRELGRLEPDDAVSILTQACRGLDYAHRNGVVHRDVKPGNLLRGRDGGQVKLADFGIAKATEHSDMTKVGSVLGTAAYLSPEQARGEPAGPASDLYALGVVSYQLLAGRLPVRGGVADRPRAPAGHGRAAAAARGRPGDPAPALARRRARARARARATASPTPRRWSRRWPTRCAGSRRPSRPPRRARWTTTEATRQLDGTAVTTPLARTQAAPAAAPAAGADRRAAPPPRRQPARRRRARRRPPPRRRRPGGAWRAIRTLLILALLAGIGGRRLRAGRPRAASAASSSRSRSRATSTRPSRRSRT